MSQTPQGRPTPLPVDRVVTEANVDDYIGSALPGAVTSRRLDDLPACNEPLVATFSSAAQPERVPTGA